MLRLKSVYIAGNLAFLATSKEAIATILKCRGERIAGDAGIVDGPKGFFIEAVKRVPAP